MVKKNNARMEQGAVFQGFRPDNPAAAAQGAGCRAGFHHKAHRGIQGQMLPGGKANAMVAEVNGPGVVFPDGGELIAAGNFGKTEKMAVGNAQGTAAVDRRVSSGAGVLILLGQQYMVGA